MINLFDENVIISVRLFSSDTMDRKKYGHFENFLESINVPIVPIFDNDGREIDWLLIAAKTVQTGLLEFLFTVDVSGHPNNRRLNTVHLRRARERPLVGYGYNNNYYYLFKY